MKITRLRLAALALLAVVISFAIPTKASAAYVGIQIGTPPPPMVVERPWAPPYRGAVWIAGHHEWIGGRWVWIGGYYTYPSPSRRLLGARPLSSRLLLSGPLGLLSLPALIRASSHPARRRLAVLSLQIRSRFAGLTPRVICLIIRDAR